MMDGIHRSLHAGYEETGEEDSGECWRLSSLSHPKTPHFCRSCMLGFRDRILLNNHLKEHYLENKASQEQESEVIMKESSEQESIFRCLNCKESFISRNQLKIHCETCMPPNTVWQCEICADVFPDKVQLHAHILAAHSAATYETTQCPHCRQHFETKHDLKVHIQIEHENDGVPVKYRKEETLVSVACECGKVFVDELNYQEHILEEHPESDPIKWPHPESEPIKWPRDDDMTSLNAAAHKKRRRVDSGSRMVAKRGGSGGRGYRRGGYSASPAPQKQRGQSGYYEEGEDGGSCVECGATFANPGDLRRHMQNDHIHLKPYACSICGRRFTRKSDVKRHIQTIHGQAVSKEDMERIQAVRPFRCAKCGNPFGRYSDIRKHIEVHHGLAFSPDTYVYQLEHLDEAGLSIGSSGEVVNVRTFECGLCKRKYRNKITVRHHIRRDHNQEDPDAFITRSAYTHGDLECQYCGTTFSCREDKLDHIQQIHQSVLVEEDNMVLSGVMQQDMLQQEDDDECFMPVKDVNTPEKLQKYSTKNQIVILKQEVMKSNHHEDQEESPQEMMGSSAPLDHRSSAPLDHRSDKSKEGTWSNTLINDIVTEQQQEHVQQQQRHQSVDKGGRGSFVDKGGRGSFDCSECSRTFTRAKALQKHVLKMHATKEDDFECDLCGKSYKEQAQFVKHLQVVHPEVSSRDKKEDKTNKNNVDLDQLFYNCDPCQKLFSSEAELIEHLDTMHSLPERELDTDPPPAPAKETVPARVVSTQSVAIDDMPLMEYYTCNVCRAMFSSTESLTRHMNVKHKDISVVTGKSSMIGVSGMGTDPPHRGDKDHNINIEYT